MVSHCLAQKTCTGFIIFRREMFDKEKSKYCLHHNHQWVTLPGKKEALCKYCGLDRNDRAEEIYYIPRLVRREVGYKNQKEEWQWN